MVKAYEDAREAARRDFKALARQRPWIMKEPGMWFQMLHSCVIGTFDRNIADQELTLILSWMPKILNMETFGIEQPESRTIRDFVLDGILQTIYDELYLEFDPKLNAEDNPAPGP
jgi:hypothetical protein